MELLRIEEIAAVEEEGRLVHVLEDGWQIQVSRTIPWEWRAAAWVEAATSRFLCE